MRGEAHESKTRKDRRKSGNTPPSSQRVDTQQGNGRRTEGVVCKYRAHWMWSLLVCDKHIKLEQAESVRCATGP